MRQPVSRIAFDPRRGFLGLHLQEGAPFVDSAWNESADITWGLLRDAIVAADIAGTTGCELAIEPVFDDAGPAGDSDLTGGPPEGARRRLRNLVVRGTTSDGSAPPRPFYCQGLPVRWCKDVQIDHQDIAAEFRAEATDRAANPATGTWIDLLEPGAPYEIYVRARVETFDGIDDPFLDDPGLDAGPGTFRKRVVAEVRIRKASAPRRRPASNVRLSVDGAYRSDDNVLYRVELDSFTGSQAYPAASVLWDPDAAATVARVVCSAAEGDRLIQLDDTEGFASGFVRFEGPGIGPALYRVSKAAGQETTAICVTRHRCDRRERSLATWQQLGPCDGDPANRFHATFTVPGRVQKGDILSGLPHALGLDWEAARVIEAPVRTPDPGAIKLLLVEAAAAEIGDHALVITDWQVIAPAIVVADGTFSALLVPSLAIERGDVITALPRTLGTPDIGSWVVLAVSPQVPVPGAPVTIAFGRAGLAQRLDTLDTARRVRLLAPARPFDTTVEVDDCAGWDAGMRIRIQRARDDDASASEAAETRTVVRIERAPRVPRRPLLAQARSRKKETVSPGRMLVRFDQPLSYDHPAEVTELVPERTIRARRFAGHDCRLDIESIDAAHGELASLSSFAVGTEIGAGLSLHLTIDRSEGGVHIERGQGWQFAARSDGFVETRMFASVDDEPACEAPLAQLIVDAEHYELIDLRPLPAAAALHEELARIEAAAIAIATQLGPVPAAQLLDEVAKLSRHPRIQRQLVRRLRELTRSHPPSLDASPACAAWLDRLRHAIDAVRAWESASSRVEPTRREVAMIAFALGGLAFAASAERPAEPAAQEPSLAAAIAPAPPASHEPEPPAPPAEKTS